ncbi:MAG: hypothetical protein ACE5IQ_01650 [Candidatus Methylomirabilales bacterium]
MGAVPARCLHCQHELRYDPINLRYRCPACNASEARKERAAGAVGEAGSPSADVWRERAEAVGRGAARLLHRVEQWRGK